MGTLIALCGIDGTGKSTQATLLQQRFIEVGQSARVVWCRWDPFLVRPAIRLLDLVSGTSHARSSKSTSRELSRGDSRRDLRRRLLSSRLVRSLWRAVMVVDYGLQAAPRLFAARRSADVVIVDRYRHDVMIDLSAGEDLGRAPRLLRWLLPEPDLTIILDVSEEVALRRKPDSPDLTYLQQRRRLYRQLAERDPSATLIEASDSTDAVGTRVLEAVLSRTNFAPTIDA